MINPFLCLSIVLNCNTCALKIRFSGLGSRNLILIITCGEIEQELDSVNLLYYKSTMGGLYVVILNTVTQPFDLLTWLFCSIARRMGSV